MQSEITTERKMFVIVVDLQQSNETAIVQNFSLKRGRADFFYQRQCCIAGFVST